MSSKAYAERLARALEGTGLCEPVNATFGDNRVNVLCRVKGEGNERKWAELLHKLLLAAEDEKGQVHSWQCHFCKNHFLKDRKMVWGWNISIQSNEMQHSLDMLMKVIKGQPIRATAVRELEEFPLVGASANRNVPKGGKGVHTIGGSQGDFNPRK